MQLLDYGFANYAIEKGREKGYAMGEVPVEKGMTDTVEAVVAEEISVLVPKGKEAQWETRTELLPAVSAPVEAGTKVGELVYLRDGEEVGRVELTAGENVAKANMDTMLRRMLAGWC